MCCGGEFGGRVVRWKVCGLWSWTDLPPDLPHGLSIHFPHLEDACSIYFMCCQEDYTRVNESI